MTRTSRRWRRPSAMPKTLRGLLTKLTHETADYEARCRHLIGVPHTAYNRQQMNGKADKIEQSIRRTLNAIERLAPGNPLVATLRHTTGQTIEACDHFPRDKDWKGERWHQAQCETIDALRAKQ